jgi:hypothetical protein
VFELAKFALNFEILTRESDEVSRSGNPFAEKPPLITNAALRYGLRGQHRPDGYRPYPKQQQPTPRTWPVARGDVYPPRLTRGIVAPVLVGHASPCANVLAGCALRG